MESIFSQVVSFLVMVVEACGVLVIVVGDVVFWDECGARVRHVLRGCPL